MQVVAVEFGNARAAMQAHKAVPLEICGVATRTKVVLLSATASHLMAAGRAGLAPARPPPPAEARPLAAATAANSGKPPRYPTAKGAADVLAHLGIWSVAPAQFPTLVARVLHCPQTHWCLLHQGAIDLLAAGGVGPGSPPSDPAVFDSWRLNCV
eukprot:scaffold5.g637.t1